MDPSGRRQDEWALEQGPDEESGVPGKEEEQGLGVGPGTLPPSSYLGNFGKPGSGCIESGDSLLPNPRRHRYPKDDRQQGARTNVC